MLRYSRFVCFAVLVGMVWGLAASSGAGVSNVFAAPDAADATPRADNGGWVEVGAGSAARGAGVSQSSGFSTNPVLAAGPDGTIVIAWEDDSNGNREIYVKRWSGSGWLELGAGSASKGGVSDTDGYSSAPAIAVAADGRPVLAWEEAASEHAAGEIYVKGWDGSAWVEIGAGSASGGGISNSEEIYSTRPSLVIGPDGNPIVAWGENGPLYLKRWDGAAWVEMGAGSASGDGIAGASDSSSDPSLALALDGKPIIAYQNQAGGMREIYVRRWNGSAWVEMGVGSATGGGISNNNTGSESPSLAVGPNGMPVVAWTDQYEYKGRIFVRRWNGSAWVEMGVGSATTEGIGYHTDMSALPSVAIGSDNAPVVAWDARANNRIYVKRWNGSAWAEVGAGSATGPGISGPFSGGQYATVALDPGGRPVVAWTTSVDGKPQIYLKRWDGSTWGEMGTGSASSFAGISSTGKADQPSLAVGPDNRPTVAWQDDSSGNWQIYARRWNGTAWAEMGAGSATGGGVSNDPSISQEPALAVGPDGLTIVAWRAHQGFVSSEVFLKRWNGTAWVEMGAGSASGNGISHGNGGGASPSLAFGPDGVPVIAWADFEAREIYVKRWNGTAWAPVGGGVSNILATSSEPTLAIGPDGLPVVAWTEFIDPSGQNSEIYVKRWNGSAWAPVGAGSASGGGISNTPYYSSAPSLAIGPDGLPVIAWTELIVNNQIGQAPAIFVKRWNGSAWAEMGAGSASGYGLSQSDPATHATYPSVVIGPGGLPVVAWSSDDYMFSGDVNIYVKRWNGSAWVEMDAGSASGDGISDFPGWSRTPSLAAGPNRLPVVAWMDADNAVTDIFVKRYPATCYALTLSHTGQGGDPTAVPARSADCPAGQYVAGEAITLIAAPAPGWIVSGWSGTTNNGSTAVANTVTMPSNAHAAGVSYRAFEGTNWGFIPVGFK